MIELLFLFYLAYKNNARAKLKGQNGILWSVITIVTCFISYLIGIYFVLVVFCRDVVDMSLLTKNNGSNFEAVSKQFNEQVMQALIANPLRQMTIMLFGIGGYLFARFLLERKPNKKEPEIHWMDKMGE